MNTAATGASSAIVQPIARVGVAGADRRRHSEAIALRDNLRDAARAVMGQLRPQDLEVVVAALYDVQRPPLLAAAFRKRLQRAVANTRTLWKRRHGDDRTG